LDNFIKNIIGFSLKNKLFIFFITLILTAVGIASYINTPIVAFPDFTNTNIHIITQWPGRSAEEVERFVTVPIEIQMNAVQRKTNLRSRSMFGLSDVNMIFEDDVEDMYARQQMTALLAEVDLPEGASASLTPPTGPVDEIFRYTLKSSKRTPAELRTIEDWVVERNIRTVPGVADVVAFGGPVKTYEISVDPNLLSKYGLTALDVYQAIQKSNINVGGDVIEKSEQAFVVRGIGLINDIPEIENITIQNLHGTPILVKNVALVKESNRPRLGQAGLGKNDDVVEAIVLMRKGIDPGPVLRKLKEKREELNSVILPADVKITTFYDRQNLIDFCLHTVLHNVVEGIILVTLIILIFMLDWRATLIVALVIPLSLLFAFICLKIMGMFANLISIGAIDFGIIVDGAVVMVEGVFVALAHKASQMDMEQFNKLAKKSIIKKYGIEMGKAIFFAKIIIITALIPIFAFQKVEGKVFSPLAFTLGFALLGALFFTLTFVPALTSVLLNKNVKEKKNVFLEFILRNYTKLFDYVFSHSKKCLLAAVLLLISSFVLFQFLGTEFLPHLNEGALWVRAQAPMSVSLTQSKALADSLRNDLSQFEEVRQVISQTGRPDDGTDVKGFFNIELLVDLYPKEEWKKKQTPDELVERINNKLSQKYTGIVWNYSQPILDNVEEAVAGIPASQAVKVYGTDLQQLSSMTDTVYSIMRKIKGVADLGIMQSIGQPELQINLNQQKMALYGVTTADANAVIEMAIGGKAASQLYEGEKKFDIRVRYQPSFRKSEVEIGNLMVPATDARIPLKEIADIKFRTGSAFVYRDNNMRYMAVKFSIRDRDLGSTIAEAERKVNASVKLPKGYKLEWTGEYESEVRASKRLAGMVPLSLLIIFIILFVNFGNLRDVTLIFLTVPFALIGGIAALFITHTNFSISAGIGFIALFGVCIQNGVILISVFKKNLLERQPLDEAVRSGAISRVRPVLMTALMAIFGLLPAAISTGIGSETQKPLAIVIIGGLCTATLLTLLILPLIFNMAYKNIEK